MDDPRPADIAPIAYSHPQGNGDGAFLAYQRDLETLAWPWALPGTPTWSTVSAA